MSLRQLGLMESAIYKSSLINAEIRQVINAALHHSAPPLKPG